MRACPYAFCLMLGACAGPTATPCFIAMTRDFRDFERWTAFDRGFDPVPPSHDGTSIIYVDAMPPAGTRAFPVGTRIVRVEQIAESPSDWEIHAMVKRGADFNAEGARDWEFFELALDRARRPSIRWRGEGPATGDGYHPAPGATEVLGCNHCHGAGTWNDFVLSPVLDLDPTDGV